MHGGGIKGIQNQPVVTLLGSRLHFWSNLFMNLPFPELHWAEMGSRGEEAHSFCIWVIPGTWRHGETGWHSD